MMDIRLPGLFRYVLSQSFVHICHVLVSSHHLWKQEDGMKTSWCQSPFSCIDQLSFSCCFPFSWKVLSTIWLWGRMCAVAHLAWKKGVCCRRAAFDVTFQHKTTLSPKTRNQPMNFAMLPMYYIGKILTIYSISAIFTHKNRYASFLHGVFGNPSCYFVYD